jgi:TRAP-type C4-dicarboxylate transport system permease small subunit
MLQKFDRVVALLCQVVSGVSFCFMALVAFVDSIGRMMNRPLMGASEYVELALMLFFFASLAFVVREDSHIRIGLFADLYKPRLSKLEAVFTNIGELCALGLLSYMLWDQASRLERFGTLTSYFKIPFAPFVYAVMALSLAAIWFSLRHILRRKNDQIPRPHALPEEEIH